jgi:hypothetical protein
MIPDFSQWKNHDPYRKAFDRLMRDLQAERQAPGAHAAVTTKENDQKNR